MSSFITELLIIFIWCGVWLKERNK